MTEEDLQQAAACLQLTVDTFIQIHTTLAPARNGLSLKEQSDGTCIFLSTENHCRIYTARPRQCRDFPHRWSDPDCPALQSPSS